MNPGSAELASPMLSTGASALIAVLELVIATLIIYGLVRSRALRSSALAVTTVLVFCAGAVEHGAAAGAELVTREQLLPAAVTTVAAWVVTGAEVVSVLLLVYYLSLHRHFGMLSGGEAPSRRGSEPSAAGDDDSAEVLLPTQAAMETLRRSLVSATHSGEPLVVLVVELDNLDELDRQGQQAVAAEVRAETGALLHDELKDSDFASPLGPDDRYLVVLPGAGVEVATSVARRTTWSIERLLVSHLVDVPVRVCVGIATRDFDGSDARTLVDSATEMAVYARRLGGGVYARSHDEQGIAEPQVDDGSEISFEAMRLSTQALMQSLYSHHPETALHSERVAELSLLIASEVGFPPEDRSLLRSAALLHDIGMLGVPREILDRDSHLTAAQYEVVKRHPRLGYELLRGTPWLQTVATYVMYHHEGVGGHGYPEKLEGREIPLASRIIAVAEAYDSMRHPQPFRKPLSIKESLVRLRKGIPMQFDTEVVAALAKLANRGRLAQARPQPVGHNAKVIDIRPVTPGDADADLG